MVRGDHASIAAYDSSGDDVTRELPWDEAGVTTGPCAVEAIFCSTTLCGVVNFSKSAGQRVEDQSFFGSLDDTTYQDFGTDLYFITDQRGYVYLVKCLGKDFLDDRHLRLNTRVTSVHHSDTCVCAMTITAGVREGATREEQFCGRYGILTFSIGCPTSWKCPVPTRPSPVEERRHTGHKVWPLHENLHALQRDIWDTTVLYIGRALLPAERGYPLFQPLGHLFDRKPHLLMAILSGGGCSEGWFSRRQHDQEAAVGCLAIVYPSYRAELLDLLIPDWAEDPLYQGSYSFPGVPQGCLT
eukprot:Em0024g162a